MKKMQKIRKAIFERDETLGVAFTVFAIIFVGAALVTAFLDTNYGLAVAAGPRGRRLHQFSEWLREREVQQ